MKLGKLLELLEGYNPDTEVCIIDKDTHYVVLGAAVGDWGQRIDIYVHTEPELKENEE